jgi:anti-sigma factor RsiW
MNHHEAKFLLRARRPGSGDAKDPVFAEALAEAEKDPALQAWLENEAAFDRTMAAKLRDIQPPDGLRDAILAGSRASQRQQTWWKKPTWLALAASIAVILAVTLRFQASGSTARDFAGDALQDLATNGKSHDGHRPELAGLQARFANATLPLPGNVKINAEELSRLGCRTVTFAGHQAFEICFQRDGHWYHLYAASVKNFSHGTTDAKSLLMTKGNFSATAWQDDNFAYALVTDGNPENLRRLI